MVLKLIQRLVEKLFKSCIILLKLHAEVKICDGIRNIIMSSIIYTIKTLQTKIEGHTCEEPSMGDPCEREATTNDTNVSLKNKRFLILFIF